MTAFDYGLLLLLVVTAGLGFWRGLVSEVLSLVAWVLAIVLGRIYAPQVATWLTTVDHPLGRYALAFLLIFVLVLLLSGVLRWLLRELLKAVGLGVADRVLGASFGFVKGLAIALLIVLAGGLLGVSQASWWRQATFSPMLETAVLAARPWLPETVAKRVRFD